MFAFPVNVPLRAGVFMVLAMASFVINDSFVKLVGRSLPVGEIIAIRGAMSACFIAAICRHKGVLGSAPFIFSRNVLIRAMLDLVGTLLFITALMHMQIANLTATMQAVPLAVTVLSVIFLKEKVGVRRTAAIVAGFIGVLLIVKPAPQSFTIYEAFALTIVLSLAVRDIITRRIPAKVPTLIVALANAVFVTAGGIMLALTQVFIAPQAWQIAYLALAAVFLGAGYMFMVATLRLGDLSATAPYRYSIVLFAIVSGVAVFGEYPDGLAYAGMLLVVATGLYAAHREAMLKDISRTPSR
ncbi:MAG: DMT family transporter [Hyphomicrobiales bacterium]